jgi:SAM-dependent methyltransferase
VIAATLGELAMLEERGSFDAHLGILQAATTCSERHWERLYATKDIAQASWHQPLLRQSMALIESVAGTPARVIDVGGGASTLAGELVARGWRNLTVLDISATALDIARARMGAEARHVKWLQGDITRVGLPSRSFDVWHDRGVFHYLTDRARRMAYVAQVRRAVRPGGHVIIGAFGLDGPRYCSGLPVMRFTAQSLLAELGDAFELVERVEERHRTPNGATQVFVYGRFVLAGTATDTALSVSDTTETPFIADSACSASAMPA